MVLDRNHIVHYLIILAIVVFGIFGSTLFVADKGVQTVWVIAVAILYLCYGVLHHYLVHDLTAKIVVEYVLVAFLVVSLFVFVRGGG